MTHALPGKDKKLEEDERGFPRPARKAEHTEGEEKRRRPRVVSRWTRSSDVVWLW
jgi:hypothetical protein